MSRAPVLRPRRIDDVPRLVEVLAAQQPGSDYPLRWPLPFPAEEFVVRPEEDGAWVAEVDGAVVGHVSVTPAPPDLAAVLARAGVAGPVAMPSVLFVAPTALGAGVGRALLGTAVAAIRAAGRTPVLEVAPANRRAVALYRRTGWRLVAEVRPAWLPKDRPSMLLMALDGHGPG